MKKEKPSVRITRIELIDKIAKITDNKIVYPINTYNRPARFMKVEELMDIYNWLLQNLDKSKLMMRNL
jgi:hypothetical protein